MRGVIEWTADAPVQTASVDLTACLGDDGVNSLWSGKRVWPPCAVPGRTFPQELLFWTAGRDFWNAVASVLKAAR